jgi:hypothetical protein
MFLRFAVNERHPDSRWWKGVFCAVYDLRGAGKISRTSAAQDVLNWFSDNLPAPTCFRRPGNHRGICWFRLDARTVVTRMWDLVQVLEKNGKPVRLYKTTDPGMRIYQDAYQVVAVPHGRLRLRSMRVPGIWM